MINQFIRLLDLNILRPGWIGLVFVRTVTFEDDGEKFTAIVGFDG
jgi:hypothetical protein